VTRLEQDADDSRADPARAPIRQLLRVTRAHELIMTTARASFAWRSMKRATSSGAPPTDAHCYDRA
jgi:hypothetical protein